MPTLLGAICPLTDCCKASQACWLHAHNSLVAGAGRLKVLANEYSLWMRSTCQTLLLLPFPHTPVQVQQGVMGNVKESLPDGQAATLLSGSPPSPSSQPTGNPQESQAMWFDLSLSP